MKPMDDLAQGTISVSWSMDKPPAPASSWHIWGPETYPPHPLDSALAWPQGTVVMLEAAFEHKLSRFTGWDLSQASSPAAGALAAQVFRRGVAVQGTPAVHLKGRYPVRILTGDDPRGLWSDDALLIVDETVAKAWKISEGERRLILQLDEESKSLETVARMTSWLRTQAGTVHIIGGGLLADTAAFAAALLARPFILIPTTLLAMLDACVGGKTGVNFGRFGKNQIGLFAFPQAVFAHTAWLTTLPEREWKAGLCEGFKHAVIRGDQTLARRLTSPQLQKAELIPQLAALIQVKADIISQDPGETGKRAILNFGHTLAHAIERLSHQWAEQAILHGEAVGVGMLFALYLSFKLRHLSAFDFRSLSDELERSSFLLTPRELEGYLGLTDRENMIEALMEGVAQDKKNKDAQTSEWILPRGWGEFVRTGEAYTVPVPAAELKTHLTRFLSLFLSSQPLL